MYLISFDKFDAMNEEAEAAPKPKTLIEVKDIYKDFYENGMELTEEKLKEILVSFAHADNPAYKKEINSILTDMLLLMDEDEIPKTKAAVNEKYEITLEKLKELTEKVKNMTFQCSYWYPSYEDLKNHKFTASLHDICFLLWIIQTDMELTKDEEFVKNYASTILQDKIQIVTE